MSTSERETVDKQIGSSTFKIKTYATAREAEAIQQAYFKGSKVEIVGGQPKISDFNPSVQFEVERALIGQLVVSMDDSAENIVERCLDLPSAVYREVIQALDEIAAAKKNN